MGERVVEQFPALHKPGDSSSPFLRKLKRQPFPGQELTIMGIAKQWEQSSTASAIAECGTGKTLIALASIFAHARGKAFTALAIVTTTIKWPFGQFRRVFDSRGFRQLSGLALRFVAGSLDTSVETSNGSLVVLLVG